MAEEVGVAAAKAVVKKVLGTSTNITYHNYIKECKPLNEFVKWADYEGNVILHAFKCKQDSKIYECFTILYFESLRGGEGITICYPLPSGPLGKVKRRLLGECPENSFLL